MKSRFLITILTALTISLSAQAYGAGVIFIDSECVTVEDIFPNIGIKDQVFCGMGYGETKKLSVQMATYIINKYNIKATPGEAYFNRKGRKLEQSEIEAAIYDKLSKSYPSAEIQIEKLRIQNDVYVAENGDFTIEISNPRIGGMYGKLNNGYREISFTAFIKGYMDAYVTTAKINKGEQVERYIKTEKVDLARLKGDLVTDPKGLVATRNIVAGVPLTGDYVSEQPDLLEGSTVHLVYNGNGVSLEAKGILQENAFKGSIIKVKNSDSGKIVTAKYQGGRTALINY